MKITKEDICSRLKVIEVRLIREYNLKGSETTRAIRKSVTYLHDLIKKNEVE